MFAEGLNYLAVSCEDIRELVNTVELLVALGDFAQYLLINEVFLVIL